MLSTHWNDSSRALYLCLCLCLCLCHSQSLFRPRAAPRRRSAVMCAPVDVASLRLRHDRLLALRSAHSGLSQWVMTLL